MKARANRPTVTKETEETTRPARLPRGVNSLPKKVVLHTQRERLVEAAAREVAERGYADTAVSHIISRAGVSRSAFYEIFKDKEECFLYGFSHLSQAHLRSVEKAMSQSLSLPEQAIAGITAYMQVLDMDPVLARAFMVEAEGASPAVRADFIKVGDRLEALIGAWFNKVRAEYPQVPECPDITHRMLRAGLTGYLLSRIREGSSRLTGEVDVVCNFAFAALGLHRWAALSEKNAAVTGAPR